MTAAPKPKRLPWRPQRLAPGGAGRLLITLAPADAARLAELSRAWGCSQAEVVRRLIRAADSPRSLDGSPG